MLDTGSLPSPRAAACGVIEFDNVNLTLDGLGLIRDVTCRLDTPGVTVLMGANGAGKSLFLRLLARLLVPDSGQVTGGRECGLSVVFQKPVLLRRSVAANIAYVLDRKKYSKGQIAEMVQAALRQARLEHRGDAAARALSGGEQQRLALARALVTQPGLLLADEITASLDPASTYIVEEMICDVAQRGTKVVFVTHDVRQAKRIGDDILFMHNGQVLSHKPADEFFRDPGGESAQNYLDGRLEYDQIERDKL